MPNLPQVAAGQIITALGWNNMVNDLNPFTQALKIANNAGNPTPAPSVGGNLFINGVNNWQNAGDEAILFFGHSEYFIKAKRDQGLTIGAKWATTGIVISDGGDTRIGGNNPARAKLEIDGGDAWVTNEWSKNLLLTAGNPSITFNYPTAATKFGIGMKNTSGMDKLHVFSTDADVSIGANSGAFTSHLVIQENGNVGVGVSNPGMKLVVGGEMKVNGRLIIEGSDLILGTNDGRAQGTKTANRALVHYDQDTLVMNFDGDFEGGVRVVGPKLVVDGNVGIGTTSPAAHLHIKGVPDGLLNLEGDGPSGRTFINFYHRGSSAGRKAWLGFGGTGSDDFAVSNEESNGNMYLSTKGNLSFGLATGKKLTINGSYLIIVRIYVMTNSSPVDTGVSFSDYNVLILESSNSNLEQTGSTWKIKRTNSNPPIGVGRVCFIRKEISDIPFPLVA